MAESEFSNFQHECFRGIENAFAHLSKGPTGWAGGLESIDTVPLIIILHLTIYRALSLLIRNDRFKSNLERKSLAQAVKNSLRFKIS